MSFRASFIELSLFSNLKILSAGKFKHSFSLILDLWLYCNTLEKPFLPMEVAATKPSKPSSNITELVSRFARVCRLRSIGVFPFENSNHHIQNQNVGCPESTTLVEDTCDANEEAECNDEKMNTHSVEVPSKRNAGGILEIEKLFNKVSALKLAYVQLQQAHLPYNPEKIIAADKLAVAELEAVCKTKRAYEKQLGNAKMAFSQLKGMRARVKDTERLLEKLKAKMKAKDSEILCLQQQLLDKNLANDKLIEKMRNEDLERKNKRVFDVSSFQDTYREASKSIHDFAKPLIGLMKAAGWNLDLAAESIEGAVVYSKRSHKKYAFEAYIARRVFHGISLQSYCVDDIMHFDDPVDALIAYPGSSFAKFCREKYLMIVHPKMEESFFGNLDQRMFIMSGKHPRTPFYRLFARMAKWVWILQGIASSVDLRAEVFSVKRGCLYSEVYMESVEEVSSEGAVEANDKGIRRVEFMVMPGFRLGETVVRSRVYLSKIRT